MNFDVIVNDPALDGLPQDLPFGALAAWIELLETKLAANPLIHSERAFRHDVSRPGNSYHDGFMFEGNVYLFTVYYWFRREEALVVYDVSMGVEPAE